MDTPFVGTLLVLPETSIAISWDAKVLTDDLLENISTP